MQYCLVESQGWPDSGQAAFSEAVEDKHQGRGKYKKKNPLALRVEGGINLSISMLG